MKKLFILFVLIPISLTIMAEHDIKTYISNISRLGAVYTCGVEYGNTNKLKDLLQQIKDSCEVVENKDSVFNTDVSKRASVYHSIKTLTKMADKGDAKAMYYLGFRYIIGAGVTQDMAEGMQWFKRSANKDYIKAMKACAWCYATGTGTNIQFSMAEKMYNRIYYKQKELADNGNIKAIEWLADYYDWCITGNKSKKRAEMLREAAIEEKNGNRVKAQELINEVFYLINLIEKEKNNNDSIAMYKIAQYYENQERTARTDSFAAYFYVKAYKNGIRKAITKIGMCFEEGRRLQKSDSMAVKCYRMGASIGDTEALVRLASCYEQGKGVEKDETQAFIYYTDALEMCPHDKLTLLLPRLANCYHNGTGVDKDEELAEMLDSAYNHLVKGEETKAMNLIEEAKSKIFIDYTVYIKYLVWAVVIMLIIRVIYSLKIINVKK